MTEPKKADDFACMLEIVKEKARTNDGVELVEMTPEFFGGNRFIDIKPGAPHVARVPVQVNPELDEPYKIHLAAS